MARAKKTGGNFMMMAPTQPKAWAMALDEENLYWSTMSSDEDDLSGGVWKLPKFGGIPELVAGDPMGPVVRTSLLDGSSSVLDQKSTPGDLAISPTKIYWIDAYYDDDVAGACRIMSLPR